MPRSLVLCPTRELAAQVAENFDKYAKHVKLTKALLIGGVSFKDQDALIDRGVDVLIATPGRLLDHFERGKLLLTGVQIMVVDEADRMLDMGFKPAVDRIVKQCARDRQTLLFSATLDPAVEKLAKEYTRDARRHEEARTQEQRGEIEHRFLAVDHTGKIDALVRELRHRDRGRTLVFVRTKLGADRVALQLRESGVLAAALHGGLTQSARNRVLGAFREGTLPVLVATDVAARGIHVDDVTVVLQVDPPADHKDYLHRSGRTARAGGTGTVITLALPHQRRMVDRLTTAAGVQATPEPVTPNDDALLAVTRGAVPSGVEVAELEGYIQRMYSQTKTFVDAHPFGQGVEQE